MNRLSVYVIAYNEADKLAAALRSVLWADEIVVADSHSTDATVKIAESLGARVVQIDFTGFGQLRNAAVAACQHEWILSLDADERANAEVREEVMAILAAPQADAYLIPRRNFFMGRWIRHSGWYPNYRQPQLFRKGALVYREDAVHEGWDLHSTRPLGRLRTAISQVPFKNLEESVRKMNRYSTLSLYRLQHVRPSMGRALTHATWAFFKHYFLKAGLLDGWPGFVIAFGYFEQTFYRYAKLVEARSDWRPPEQPEVRRPPQSSP